MKMYSSRKLDAFVKVLVLNLHDDKSINYHALYGCRESFYETVNHSNHMELLGV
jgi:hypothetical protein